MLVLGTAEKIVKGAKNREHRGLPAAALFREPLLALLDFARHPIMPDPLDARCGQAREALRNRVRQNAAALVQRIDREPAPAGGENQRRGRQAPNPPPWRSR